MRYDIKITKMQDENSNLLGYADVNFGGSFAVKAIKIMNGNNGPFVSMPSYKSAKDGEYKDICFPITADFREKLYDDILAAYHGNNYPLISKITCTSFEDKGNLKGLADVTFNNSFVIKGVKIMNSEKGLFVSMPNYKVDKDGETEFHDICFPTTAEFRTSFSDVVLEAFAAERKGENVKTYDVNEPIPRYNITVHKMKDSNSNVLAYADVNFGGSFVIKGIKVMDSEKGPFVSMPNYKTNKITDEGKEIYQDLFFPITAEFRQDLYDNILSAYDGSKKPSITDVRCTSLNTNNDNEHLKGLANVVFDDCFALSGVKLYASENGVFVSMPNYKVNKDGKTEFHDMCFPTTAEFREELNTAVMSAYNKSFDMDKDKENDIPSSFAEDVRPISRGKSR